jgi:uncharacterized protein (DUF1778 family)
MAIQMSRVLEKIPILTCLSIGYTLSDMPEKPKRRHSSALFIRVTPEHEELVKQAAELAGTSLSDWIRDRLVRTARREIAEAARYEATGKASEK